MKKSNFICVCSSMVLLAGCTKPYFDFPSGGDHDEKEYTLKSMVYYASNSPSDVNIFTFSFYFNKKRELDSINMDPQVVGGWAVFHTKNKIDSVVQTLFGPYSNGLPISWRSGFVYDNRGDFTRFNITFRTGSPQTIIFTYDRGQPHTATRYTPSDPLLNKYDTFAYVKNDLVRWSSAVQGSGLDTRDYTYDPHHYNPLYPFADDLRAALFGSTFSWEFFMGSEHVTTSKTHRQSQQVVTYQNFYDRKGRLIKKVFTEPGFAKPDSLTFQYVK